MKRRTAILLAASMLAMSVLPLAAQASTASIYFDGSELIQPGSVKPVSEQSAQVYVKGMAVTFDAEPIENDGSLLVPLRQLGEALGAEVGWNFLTEEATLTYNGKRVTVKEGLSAASVDGSEITISRPVQKIGNLLYAPVRFVAESLGFYVNWDEEKNEVRITTSQMSGSKNEEPADIGNIYEVVSVSASEDDGNEPQNVLDRNYDTRWSAERRGANITLDLGEVKPIAYVGVACYNGTERQTTLSVQVSTDGTNFKEVVTRWVSSITADMEPIDLGGVYDARYVRLLGYGNTVNNWNSLTEISVYGSYDGEGMPVATDGPGASGTVESLPQEYRDALAKLDQYYERIPLWIANLYDPVTGGFFMSMSGKDDPNISTGLEMTAFALDAIAGYTDANMLEMPDSLRQRFTDYYVSRQDPSGYFIDLQGPVNDRETARNQGSSLKWMYYFNAPFRYVHPSMLEGDEVAGDSMLRPDYVNSVDSYIDWVANNWNWDTDSWTAGDQTHQSMKYLSYYLTDEQEEQYKQALLEWLNARTEACGNGMWSPRLDFNAVSGAFKVCNVYRELGLPMPDPDKTIESFIKCFETDVPETAHYVRNPISVFRSIADYSEEYKQKVGEVVVDHMDKIIGWIDLFTCPDGGFSMRYHKSMGTFGGIDGSHQLWEGDIDSTSMLLTTRKEIYALLGVAAPPLKCGSDFWQWLSGEKETPSCYLDEQYAKPGGASDTEPVTMDFENLPLGAVTGKDLGANDVNGMKLSIVADKDRRNNKALAMDYQAAGLAETLSIPLGDGADLVRYAPLSNRIDVLEYDLKLENMAKNANNVWLLHGSSAGYALNICGTQFSTRISGAVTADGGYYKTVEEKQWYRVRIESIFGETAKDYKVRVYIDGEEVAATDHNFGYPNSTPGAGSGSLGITWYLKGAGRIYMDNLVSYTKSR